MKYKFARLAAFILVFLLAAAMVSVTAFADSRESLDMSKFIKVGLYYSSTYASTITIESDDGFYVYDEYGEYVKSIDDKTINLTSSDTGYDGLIFMSAAPEEDSRMVKITTDRKTKDKTYRDGVQLFFNSGIRVLNFVTLEHYLWGVVNKEMSYTNPAEALKAQAVCARTYASKFHHGDGSKRTDFNVCTTTDCQSYGGIACEHSLTTQACRETEGIVAVYDGELIDAYFSSASGGGYTMSLHDAWGIDDVPYLTSVRDEFTPKESEGTPWSFYNTFDEIRQRLIDAGYQDVGSVQSVEVTNQNSFGAATQITVTGNNGTAVVPRSKLMTVFKLKSTTFVIGSDDYKEIGIKEATPKTFTVYTADGIKEVSSDNIYVYDGKTTKKLDVEPYETYTFESDVCSSGYVYWSGVGFGHGIGMSQSGAVEMAKQGYTYDQILKYYYTGIDLADIYEKSE